MIRLLLALVLAAPVLAEEERAAEVEEYLARDDAGPPPVAPPSRGVRFRPINPTDPTQFDRGLGVGFEWVSLSGGEGDLIFLNLTASQPFGRDDQMRLALLLPFGTSDTRTASSGVGIGDVRVNAAWRPFEAESREATFQAWSLELDVLFPTGSARRSLGAGDWVVAPATWFKLRTKSMFWYAGLRWLYGDRVNPAGIRGFNIPGSDAFANTTARERLSALNVELSAAWEFDRRKSPVHWFAITADYTANLEGSKNQMLLLKTKLGREISDQWSFDLDFWFPLAGERTQSFTLRFVFVWEF
ncbi:MAG: hypothetical protein AAGD14_18460 [Planctomycetota bacterium]